MPVDPRIQAALDAPLREQVARFKPKRGPARKSGYPLPPGTGPAGQTCGSCANLVRRAFAKTYLKCRFTAAGGAATDVRAKSPACSAWEARAVQ